MRIITVSGRQVIECAHCLGTSLCMHSTYVEVHGGPRFVDGYGVSRCSKCGDGVRNSSKSPVCAVCGGKGHTFVG